MKVLVAPDKFKGSLSSLEAAEAISRGWRSAWPECELRIAPIADGGEGFAPALCESLQGEWIATPAHDALGRSILAHYAWVPGRRLAIMEMSETSGLWRLGLDEREPRRADTFGTGELLRHAAGLGAKEIYVGLGGSATTDGGCGLARALGFRFLDDVGDEISCFPADLARLHSIDPSGAITLPTVVAACDVENPLLGAEGTASVFSPQKGASREDVLFLEAALAKLAEVAARDLGCDFRQVPGAGAAGGLGYGLLTFAGAEVRSGFSLVAEATSLPDAIRESDLVLTGEGRLDRQTLSGKGPAGVAALARGCGCRTFAFGGGVEDETDFSAVFARVVPINPGRLPLAEAIAKGGELLEAAAAETAACERLARTHLPT